MVGHLVAFGGLLGQSRGSNSYTNFIGISRKVFHDTRGPEVIQKWDSDFVGGVGDLSPLGNLEISQTWNQKHQLKEVPLQKRGVTLRDHLT